MGSKLTAAKEEYDKGNYYSSLVGKWDYDACQDCGGSGHGISILDEDVNKDFNKKSGLSMGTKSIIIGPCQSNCRVRRV